MFVLFSPAGPGPGPRHEVSGAGLYFSRLDRDADGAARFAFKPAANAMVRKFSARLAFECSYFRGGLAVADSPLVSRNEIQLGSQHFFLSIITRLRPFSGVVCQTSLQGGIQAAKVTRG